MGCLASQGNFILETQACSMKYECESSLTSMSVMVLLCQLNYDHIEIFMSTSTATEKTGLTAFNLFLLKYCSKSGEPK